MPALADGFTPRPESAPALAALRPGAVLALVSKGPGSCGKTQLAAHAARALWRSGQVAVVAWVDASSRASLLAGYARAAAAAGIDLAGPAEQAAARLTGWLAATTRPWLLVLDDVRDAADLDGLWPAGPAGQVVLTARDKQAVSGPAGQPPPHLVPVGPFTTRESLAYLMNRLAGDPDQRHGAIDLALALGGDPLALAHASAVIATTTQSCADYHRHYDDLAARLTGHAPTTPPGAAVTWLLSAERAAQLAPAGATRMLLALAALLDGQAIPAALLTTPAVLACLAEAATPAPGPGTARDAVQALTATGLLTLDPAADPPAARLSRQVAALARAAIPGPLLDRAAAAAADALLEIWPPREQPCWAGAGIRSCAAALQHTAARQLWTAEDCHLLLPATGHSLAAAGLTGPAVAHWTQLAATSQRLLGPDTPHTLTAGTHLAEALAAAGQAAQATAWWQWVTAARTRTCGPGHPDTLTARLSLGQALTAAGQPADAVTVLDQALADHDQARGPGHPATLAVRAALAAACQAAGQHAEAIRHYWHLLASHERLHGTRHPATMTARAQLAAACQAAGGHSDAIRCYKTTLADREHALGADHPDTLATRRDLAAACQAAGQITAALHHYEKACAGHEQALGASHPATLACQAGLARACLAAGRLADAAAMLRATLTRCEQHLPPGDPLTATVRQALTTLAAP